MLPLNQLQWPNIQMCALVKYKTFRVNFSLFWSSRLKSGSAVTTNLKPILVHTKFRQFCLFCVFSIWWHCGPDWYGPWAAFCQSHTPTMSPAVSLRAQCWGPPSSPSICFPWAISSAGMGYPTIAMLMTHNSTWAQPPLLLLPSQHPHSPPAWRR